MPIREGVFGVLAPLVGKKNTAAFAATIADLAPAQRVVAARASLRGPVPTDPAVRTGALRLCTKYLEMRKKRGKWLYILIALGVVVQLVLVFTLYNSEDGFGSSAVQFTAVVLFALAFIADWYNARRYRRQHGLLAAGHDAVGQNIF